MSAEWLVSPVVPFERTQPSLWTTEHWISEDLTLGIHPQLTASEDFLINQSLKMFLPGSTMTELFVQIMDDIKTTWPNLDELLVQSVAPQRLLDIRPIAAHPDWGYPFPRPTFLPDESWKRTLKVTASHLPASRDGKATSISRISGWYHGICDALEIPASRAMPVLVMMYFHAVYPEWLDHLQRGTSSWEQASDYSPFSLWAKHKVVQPGDPMAIIMTKPEYQEWLRYHPKHGEFITSVHHTLKTAVAHPEWWTTKSWLWQYRTTYSDTGFKITRWDRHRQGAIANAMPDWDAFIRICHRYDVIPARWLGFLVWKMVEQDHGSFLPTVVES